MSRFFDHNFGSFRPIYFRFGAFDAGDRELQNIPGGHVDVVRHQGALDRKNSDFLHFFGKTAAILKVLELGQFPLRAI